MKAQFGLSRIKQIDTLDETSKKMVFDIEILKENFQTVVLKSELEPLEDILNQITPQNVINDMRNDILDKANKQDIDILKSEM